MAALTPVQQAAYHQRTLGTLKSKVSDMAAAWGDLDCYFESRLEELAKDIEELQHKMSEYIAEEKKSS